MTITPSAHHPTTTKMHPPTALSIRQSCRSNTYTSVTAGLAPSHIQANLIVLPSRYASDFRLLCQRNPVPCPLLGESLSRRTLRSHLPTISPTALAEDIDLARDCPRYTVYRSGSLIHPDKLDVVNEWTDDHVAFLIGCSYSFETALARAGMVPPHVKFARNVPMYRTTVPLCAAGVFKTSCYVVSMRMYRRSEVERVREVTRPFVATHGEPVAWGWEGARRIGVGDVGAPEWGDGPVDGDGKVVVMGNEGEVDEKEDDPWVPVFWGCGVTPQEAVMKAGLEGIVLGHAPGHMLLLDIGEEELLQKTTGMI